MKVLEQPTLLLFLIGMSLLVLGGGGALAVRRDKKTSTRKEETLERKIRKAVVKTAKPQTGPLIFVYVMITGYVLGFVLWMSAGTSIALLCLSGPILVGIYVFYLYFALKKEGVVT